MSLWLWGLLFIFALSSVALNLYSEIYRPLMSQVMTFQPEPLAHIEKLESPLSIPPMGWRAGYLAAKKEFQLLAEERSFRIHQLERFSYDPDRGLFKLMATTSRDVNQRFGRSWLYIDAVNGERKAFALPSGEASGDTLTSWLTTLHIAAIWGFPYRVLVSLIGCFVAILCITGFVLWRRNRRAHKKFLASKKRL